MTKPKPHKIDRAQIWSYGGGIQTIAILVLIAQGKLPKPELAIFADTGRERSSTWRYYEKHAKPLLDKLNIPFIIAGHELAKVDLYAHNGDLLIPAFTKEGKLPTFCSSEWKTMVIHRKLRELGYGPKQPVEIWLGMSLDEIDRLKQSTKKWIKHHWPLVFDIKLRRHECENRIQEYGLPIPSKSACWGCPHLTNPEWSEIKEADPEDFKKAVELDRKIRKNDKWNNVYLHRDAVPLEDADLSTNNDPLPLFECSGNCWT